MQKLKLSPSALSIFLDCPRCFWLDRNKNLKRPRGIYPSLPIGMDSVIKTYFDKYRKKNEMPPEIKDNLPGKLFSDMDRLEKWRSWFKTDLSYENHSTNATLSGALDDCLVEDGLYIPLDYKTRGSELIDEGRFFTELEDITEKIRSCNKQIKVEKRSRASKERLLELYEKRRELKKEKEEQLNAALQTVSDKVMAGDFKIGLTKNEIDGQKSLYVVADSPEHYFAMKQVQSNVSRLFGVKQANRYEIISQLKTLLGDTFPKYIVRTLA